MNSAVCTLSKGRQNLYSRNNLTPKINFKGLNSVKTLECLHPESNDFKYFKNGVPVLATYIPQGFFGVQKFSNEASRFLGTDGVACCTKLVMHDSTSKMGFLAHVDSSLRMVHSKSIENIKNALGNVNPANFLVKNLRGFIGIPEEGVVENTIKFMEKLGIPEKNLIKEDLLASNNSSSGIFLDIKTGETYDADYMPRISQNDFDSYKQRFNQEEYESFIKAQKSIHDLSTIQKATQSCYLSNING